tara:strand:- start:365 stop:829 length:465 start_codon:yes stop_codon:yes gene_type:complete
MKKLLFLFIPLVFFFSCDVEEEDLPSINTDSLENTIYHEVSISNSIPGSFTHQHPGGGVMDNFVATDPSGVVNGVYNTDTYNLPIIIPGFPMEYTCFFHWHSAGGYGCVDVTITTYMNDTPIQEDVFQLGTISANPAVYCASHGNSYNYTFTLN